MPASLLSKHQYFSDKPVPETLIERVLGAGRFAPSSGNYQPWQFVVINRKSIIQELDRAALDVLENDFSNYMGEEKEQQLAVGYAADPNPGAYDPRIVLGGKSQSMAEGYNLPSLGAPVMVLLCGDYRLIRGTHASTIGHL